MFNDSRALIACIVTVLLFAGFAMATDVRTLNWEELIPEADEPQVLTPPGGANGGLGGDEGFDWEEEDTFEALFATPVYPTGVVEDLDRERVKLPGFIVPLEIVDDGKVSEFLLVPYFGACIHYPAPPPNQIVYVTMPDAIEIESMWDPVWVTGEIRTESRHSDVASAGYSMTAENIEDYEY